MKIGIYGLTNVGKSTLVNFLCGQSVSIVSPERGTTTDPVHRRIEILDYAPVTFIDTAGLDDHSPLGAERVEKSYQSIEQIDLAIILTQTDCSTELELDLIERLGDIPYITIERDNYPSSAEEVFEKIREAVPAASLIEPDFYGGRIQKGDTVILVCPIDSEAPSGRMILPQMQGVRGALDLGAMAIVVQPTELPKALSITQPKLVVTDSQVFDIAKKEVKERCELTSFSILLAERKGDKELYTQGLEKIESLKEKDKILILESCSHQVSCEDIGRVKIPRLLGKYTGKNLEYKIISGKDPLPKDLKPYALAVQCGGCMTTRGNIQNRLIRLKKEKISVTNYGMLLRKLL